MKTILPSLMPQNQKELDQDFKKLKGIKTLHLDIIDGKFANNKTFQFPFKLKTTFKYHAHLMVKRPELFIKKYLKKIHLFLPQFEETPRPEKYIQFMKTHKKPVGFALKPETKVKVLKPHAKHIDYILILTVHPGFYGGKFLPSKLKKIKEIKTLNKNIKVIVDGGMNPKTIKQAKAADFFVSGSYITKADNPKQSIKNLLKALY